MKHHILFLKISMIFIAISFPLISSAQFITKWETTSSNQSIDLNARADLYNYKYDVNWGDGSSNQGLTNSSSHKYANSGNYTVTITGIYPYFNLTSYVMLKEVSQWGTNPWKSMNGTFTACNNLNITAVDTPFLAEVTDMTSMFEACTILNPGGPAAVAFNSWHTGHVQKMGRMFYFNVRFNQNIGDWDVSAVTDMNYMFGYAAKFNQDIGSWKTEAVTVMDHMFFGSDSFNQNIGGWDISNVNSMDQMFLGIYKNSDMSQANYDKLLIGWNNLPNKQSNVKLGALGLKYCDGNTARSNLKSNNGWIISGDAPAEGCESLPLVLLNFTVQKSGTNDVLIKWSSASENGVSFIYIEKSNDASSWKRINTQKPKGNNSQYVAYDINPNVGKNYYRLLTADLDGSKSYSNIQSINFSKSLESSVFPNPTKGLLKIKNLIIGDDIVLIDLNGRQIMKEKANNPEKILKLNSFAPGTYFILIVRDGVTVMKEKIMKVQ